MTSDPTPAAHADSPPVGPATSVPGRLPWRGFLVDSLLAGVLLVGLSTMLIVPIVIIEMMANAPDGKMPAGEPDLSAMMPEITAAAIVAMLLTAVLVWWLRGRSLTGPMARMAPLAAYGLATAAGIFIQLVSQAFSWMLAESGAGPDPSNAEPVTALLQSAPWMAWLLIVIVGPFSEELLMRHVLLRRFAVAGYAVAGLVLTSVAFALLHEPVPTSAGVAAWLGGLAMYTAMGAGFALVYLRTGRFRAAFLAHAACNATALVLTAYSTS